VSGLALLASLSGCVEARARLQTGGTVASSDATSAEQSFVTSINAVRAKHGLRALAVNAILVNKARGWAGAMANGVCGVGAGGVPNICHSKLSDHITVAWSLLEENVGSAAPRTNVGGLELGFEHSPLHLANMLNAQVRYLGVGVAYWNDHIYVAEEYMAP
jgi:uncharacterized protein YkwD